MKLPYITNIQNPLTWRIIPGLGYVVNDHGGRKSSRVVGPHNQTAYI